MTGLQKTTNNMIDKIPTIPQLFKVSPLCYLMFSLMSHYWASVGAGYNTVVMSSKETICCVIWNLFGIKADTKHFYQKYQQNFSLDAISFEKQSPLYSLRPKSDQHQFSPNNANASSKETIYGNYLRNGKCFDILSNSLN